MFIMGEKKNFKYHMSLLNRHTEASLMQSVPLFLIWKPFKSLHAVVSLLLQRILITLNRGSHFQAMQCAGTCTLTLFLIESSCSRAVINSLSSLTYIGLPTWQRCWLNNGSCTFHVRPGMLLASMLSVFVHDVWAQTSKLARFRPQVRHTCVPPSWQCGAFFERKAPLRACSLFWA